MDDERDPTRPPTPTSGRGTDELVEEDDDSSRSTRSTSRCRSCRDVALDLLTDGELAIVGRLWARPTTPCCARDEALPGPRAGPRRGGSTSRSMGERPLDDFPDETLARREVAAFHVSEATGWGIVPPTVLRDGPFGEGMVQLWIDADPDVDVVAMVVEDDPRLRRIAVFDAAVNNTDRKGGHLLPVPGGHVYGVDHGVTFSPVPKLRTVLWGWRGRAAARRRDRRAPRAARGARRRARRDAPRAPRPDRGRAPPRAASRRCSWPASSPSPIPAARAPLAARLTITAALPGSAADRGARPPLPARRPHPCAPAPSGGSGWGTMAPCGDGTAGASRASTRTSAARPVGSSSTVVGQAGRRRAASLADVVAAVPPSRLEASPAARRRPGDARPARPRPVAAGPARPPLRAPRRRPRRRRDARRTGPGSARSSITPATPTRGSSRTAAARASSAASRLGPRPTRSITVDCSRLAGRQRPRRAERPRHARRRARPGPALADALAPHGLTVGHEPQSWELATVGGWVAARGSGLRSLGLGRIEQLFAGGVLEAPAGTLEMAPYPASAAGPDLRQLVLGSEGRLGFLTDVVLRAVPLPDRGPLRRVGHARTGTRGLEAARDLARAGPGLTVAPALDARRDARRSSPFADRPSQIRALHDVPPCAPPGRRLVPPARRRVGLEADRQGAPGRRRPRSLRARRRRPAAGVRGRVVPRPVPLALPAQRAWCGGLRRGHARDRGRLGARAGARSPASRRRSPRRSRRAASGSTCSPTSRTSTRSGSSLYLTYLFRLARRPGRDARPVAGDQAGGVAT